MSQNSNIFVKMIESLIIFVSLYLIVGLYDDARWSDKYLLLGISAAFLYTLLSEIAGSFYNHLNASLAKVLVIVTLLWAAVIGMLIVYSFLNKSSAEYSRFVVLVWFTLVPVMLITGVYGFRSALAHWYRQGGAATRVAIAGGGEMSDRVRAMMERNTWLGYQLAGIYDDREPRKRDGKPVQLTGNFRRLIEDARAGKVQLVFIALPMDAQIRIMSLIDKLADSTVSVYLLPDFFISSVVKHGQWRTIAGMSVIGVYDTPFWGVTGWLKRTQDILLALLFILLTAVPMLLIALAILLTSRGPVIFRQKRYGIDGEEIAVFKFRSMRVMDDGAVVRQATRNDSRITPLGRFLRRTSLDELPQFFNVLSGSMSIVGPRPHAVAHNEEYRKRVKGYMLRYKVKPGITGWAQINGWRGETDTLEKMEKRIEYDLWYINNWSVWLDLKIIILTVFRGFVGKQAY